MCTDRLHKAGGGLITQHHIHYNRHNFKACISIPGISDHSIVLADCDLKATINKKPPRKVYQWSKADWQLIKEQTVIFAKQFLALARTRTVKENYTVFIEYMEGILAVNIPSKLLNSRYNLPWMNRNLKRLIRKKGRRFKKAKKSGMDEDRARYLDIERHSTEWPRIREQLEKSPQNKKVLVSLLLKVTAT